MVLIGGITRLTNSGLSIVYWKPIMGVIPPLTEETWEKDFDLYKQSPEYKKINFGMTMPEFKQIFYVEYFHRLIGRLAGFVFFVPFVYFLCKRTITKTLAYRLAIIFALGGLQGFLGWYMVSSGLVDHPNVSQYRLTLHLFMAFALFGLLLWSALDMTPDTPQPVAPKTALFSLAVTFMIALQAISGGFVAGLDAGLTYNTFPTMNGQWIPNGLGLLDPWYLNLFENVTTVQFNHRIGACLVTGLIIAFWFYTQRPNIRATLSLAERNMVHLLAMMLVVQVSLGVFTLLHHVPVIPASAHQLGALVLFSIALTINHRFIHTSKAGTQQMEVRLA